MEKEFKPAKMLKNIRYTKEWLERMVELCCCYEACGDCPMYIGTCGVNERLLQIKKVIKSEKSYN